MPLELTRWFSLVVRRAHRITPFFDVFLSLLFTLFNFALILPSLHEPWQAHPADVVLDFYNRCLDELVSHSLEEMEILTQLFPPDIDEQMLADSVAAHVPLNRRCVHILVSLD